MQIPFWQKNLKEFELSKRYVNNIDNEMIKNYQN